MRGTWTSHSDIAEAPFEVQANSLLKPQSTVAQPLRMLLLGFRSSYGPAPDLITLITDENLDSGSSRSGVALDWHFKEVSHQVLHGLPRLWRFIMCRI